MQYTLKQTHNVNTLLRLEVCNRVEVATKKTRPVFIARENPDTPPAITDSTREIALFMRNANRLIAKTGFIHSATWLHVLAVTNDDTSIAEKTYGKIQPKNRPLWVCASAPVKGKESGKIYTAYGNIRPEDKPAFRHDSMYLFDVLSEDY